MKKTGVLPVIAIDIDDVLFPFLDEIVHYHNRIKGATLSEHDYTTFQFGQVWGVDEPEAVEIVNGFLHSDHMHLQPIPGAQASLERLSKDFQIVLVTARHQEFEESTATWLKTHLPGLFQNVVFAGNPHDGRPYRTKGEICQELGARLLIDDHPQNLLSAAEYGIDGILFGTKSWSVLDGGSTHITACRDWQAVMECIYHDSH